MSFVYYGIFCVIFLTLLTLSLTLLSKKPLDKKVKVAKIFSFVLAGVFSVRYLITTDALDDVVEFVGSPFSSSGMTGWITLLTWFSYCVNLLIILYPFARVKTVRNIIKYFGTVVSLLQVGFLLFYIRGICGDGAFGSDPLAIIRAVLMTIEVAITLCYSLNVLLGSIKDGSWKLIKKDYLYFFLCLAVFLIGIIPPSTMQIFFGEGNPGLIVNDLSPIHRMYIYFAFLFPIIFYFSLRDQNKETIWYGVLYLSLGTLITFSSNFKVTDFFHSVTNLPLHLCHTAMYVVPICIIFKWKKLFYFTYFINVFGALLAILMPNCGDALMFQRSTMVFWTNHYIAFSLPLICVALKLFERPTIKQFKYSMIAFGVYFFVILFVDAWFLNYDADVDYFFLNSNYILDQLGNDSFEKMVFGLTWEFDIGKLHFLFHPIFQSLFFVVYIGLAFAMWFIYEQFFAISDLHYDMLLKTKKFKQDKYALQCQLNGRKEDEPMEEINSDKLILRKFSKKYGTSKSFAVEEVDLEVHGGEIFGFLGPNGAGKSTIIKSIVGVQPITSGQIMVAGYDIAKQSVCAKRKIGFVPDHYALYEKLTGREYINYIADLYEVTEEDRNARINKYVEQFELQNAFDNQMQTYSHGMKQKITIMAALVHNPKLWILDEPLTGLDPTSIYQVKECMKEHAKAGNIVFFSSHIIDVVEKLCDRIAIIKKGKIQTVRTVKDIEAEGIDLEDFYLKTIGEELPKETK